MRGTELHYKEIESSLEKLEVNVLRSQATRFLSLDLGRKKIGCALGFFQRNVVLPYKVLTRLNNLADIKGIYKIAADFRVEDIVIGLPLQSGQLQTESEYMLEFASMLSKDGKFCIYFQDESFSTNEAISELQKINIRRKKRDAIDDAVAAAVILDDFFKNIRSRVS